MSTPSAQRKEVYFLRITPFNWILAWLYSLSSTVCYWRSTLPLRLLARFRRLAVESEISRDQWLLISDSASDLWRTKVYPHIAEHYPLPVTYRGTEIDFSVVLAQHLSQEFERIFQLCRVLESVRGPGARVVEPWVARVFPPSLMAEIVGRCTLVASPSNRLLESPYEWSFTAGHLLRLARVALRRLTAERIEVKPGAVFWTGIAPQEMAVEDFRLDFRWPTRYAGVPPDDIVYFLPIEPSERHKEAYARDRCTALGPTAIGSLVSVGAAFRALAAAAATTARALLFDRSAVAPYRALFAARAFLWIDIAEALRPARYVTTTSYCWPERPEVAALAAKGVNTTIWSYSANALTFSADSPDYRDLTVVRTLFLAREFWVWNEAYRDWMVRRQVGGAARTPEFRIAGPLMCGDAAWLTRERKLAKQRLGLDPDGFYLAVFDVPLSGLGHRRTFYGGPRMFVDGYHEAFFKGLIELLDAYPALRVFIKLKRPISSQWHKFPKSQLALLDETNPLILSRRVVIIHQDTDPYLPIAACDAALGMPYTSPVLGAIGQGKPGAYFDPLGLARYPSELTYNALVISTAADLKKAVGEWLAGAGTPDMARVRRLLPLPEAGFDMTAAIRGEEPASDRTDRPVPRAASRA